MIEFIVYYILCSLVMNILFYIISKRVESKKEYVVLNKDITFKDVNIEVINDILYAYEKETNTFLCQGASLEEIAEKFKSYNKIYMASVYINNQRFILSNGNIYN